MANNKIIDLERLSRFKDKLDDILETKANVDGNYPTMTVGSADNLTPYGENSGVEESTPFVFQSAGGSSDIGSQAQLRALRGNSVAFNQLIKNGNFADTSNWYVDSGTFSVSNNVCSYTSNGTVGNALKQPNLYSQGVVNGHKYFMKADVKLTTATNKVYLYLGYSSTRGVATTATTNWQTLTYFVDLTAQIGGSNCWLFIRDQRTSDWDEIQVKNVQLFDLTLMFGAGNEPTSVLEFNRLFPKQYYEYNAGTLLSCKSNGYKTVGYNAWDEEWEQGAINTEGVPSSAQRLRSKNFTRVIAGQNYSFYCSVLVNFNVFYYDIDKNFIGSTTKTNSATNREAIIEIPQNVSYIKFYLSSEYGNGTFYNHDIAIHLTWDSSRTGYEPYESETYALPNVELRSAGSVYDELRPDGTLIRRVGVVDLGTLTWTWQSANGRWYSSGLSSLTKAPSSNNQKANIISNKYEILSFTDADTNSKGLAIATSGTLFLYTSDSTNQPSGYLFYELATPTEEQTEYTFAETTPIDDYGTQEFLYDNDIDIPVPQGNEFFYPVDYKAFVDSLGGRDDIEYAADQVVSQTQLTQALSTFLSSISGYDATKTQTLKNVNGVFQWVDD